MKSWAFLEKCLDSEAVVLATPVRGGSINEAFHIRTANNSFFLKQNSAAAFPGMFEAEVKGLDLLRQCEELKIPEVLTVEQEGDQSYLLLEYIDSSPTSDGFFEKFGRALADLHSETSATFGLDHSNYIGILEQINTAYKTWVEFFIACRLNPMLRMATDKKLLNSSDLKAFESLFLKLPSLFPEEKPALLHGDLWSGNFLSAGGKPCVFDPAVYYGFREMDIAMSKLFGGFGPAFYHAYNEAFPMEKGWEDRVELCNLYPLLVHLNLFGRSYHGQILSILRKF